MSDKLTVGKNTFIIRILRQEHGTWQGQVEHMQTGTKHNFQSCLEMIMFLITNLQ